QRALATGPTDRKLDLVARLQTEVAKQLLGSTQSVDRGDRVRLLQAGLRRRRFRNHRVDNDRGTCQAAAVAEAEPAGRRTREYPQRSSRRFLRLRRRGRQRERAHQGEKEGS